MEPPRNPTDSQDKTTDELLEEMTASRDEAVAHGHDIDAMLEAVTDPMVVYDLLTEVVRTNPAFRALLQSYSHASATATLQERVEGLALRDLEGELLADAQLPQQRLLHGESITDADPTQIMTRGESGREGVFSVTGKLLYHEERISGAVVFFRDITQQHQLAGDLRQSEQRYRTLFEFAPVAVYSCDADGVIQEYNAHAAEMWGRTPRRGDRSERYCGSFRMYSPEGRYLPHDQCPMARVLQGEALLDGKAELLVERPDGQRMTVMAHPQAIRNERGEITGAINCFYDITDRKLTEEALSRAKEELEARVEERTRDLAAANRSLRRLSQRILGVQEGERRLIAQELHDEIGQALTGVKMMLETLDEYAQHNNSAVETTRLDTASDQPPDAPDLGDISAAVAHALEQVRDLSLDLRPAILDSLGLLPALEWQLERYTNQTGVQVDFSTEGLDHRLPTHLEAGVYRLIQEALTNVARYAGVSAVTVQIHVTEETLTLYVVDEGAGFDVGEALDAGVSTGLAGMRERAALLGGTLTIDSIPGEGTTIHADLSITQAIEVEAAQESTAESTAESTQELEGERGTERDAARDKARDHLRDLARDSWRDRARDAKRDTTRDSLRDTTRDAINARQWQREEQEREQRAQYEGKDGKEEKV
jgi:PAS domain S-box-containing protein